ncbi:MAG: phosphoribosylamine--glycine ligase [Nitrospirales bacterium]|nr:phosphoribosylamine--glycine ligase [Nitrospira sp.]MDR4487480.1 phosphoribosylamine--glycine ligase [Nitrospirales bacterium]HQU28636.1 phosphoribosylamine--glycine ligase [Nitrospirales bacterium]
MKVLIIGSGGREHALAWKVAQSPRLTTLYCAPGNAGIAQVAKCVPIKVDDLPGLKAFALQEGIDLTIVGPELPLSLGIADEFRKAKLRIFGPTQNAAMIESSKSFAKDLMVREHIPTALSRTFERIEPAMAYIHECAVPLVVKADGLAAGKGVIICSTRKEAIEAVTDMLEGQQFGQAGAKVVVEEFIEGEELTVMAFADGRTVIPMIPAQDHKRIGEGDTGLNTGGMGAYAPAPLGTSALRERILQEVLYPAVNGLSRVGSPYYGVLYAGIMVRKDGQPFVLEFNARFGDPETQVVLPLLKTDLLDIIEAVVQHRLDQVTVEWHDQAAVCVVLTSGGYPGAYKTGMPITGLPVSASKSVMVFHAGTDQQGQEVVSHGGRVLGVTALDDTIRGAQKRAYEAVAPIQFEGRYFRSDIAHRVL